MSWVKIDPLWEGELRGLVIAGRPVLLVNAGGAHHAYEDRCLHKAVKLSAGRLEGTTLTCSAHEWTYDVTTGCGINPASVCLRAFAVEERGEEVFVDVEAETHG